MHNLARNSHELDLQPAFRLHVRHAMSQSSQKSSSIELEEFCSVRRKTTTHFGELKLRKMVSKLSRDGCTFGLALVHTPFFFPCLSEILATDASLPGDHPWCAAQLKREKVQAQPGNICAGTGWAHHSLGNIRVFSLAPSGDLLLCEFVLCSHTPCVFRSKQAMVYKTLVILVDGDFFFTLHDSTTTSSTEIFVRKPMFQQRVYF